MGSEHRKGKGAKGLEQLVHDVFHARRPLELSEQLEMVRRHAGTASLHNSLDRISVRVIDGTLRHGCHEKGLFWYHLAKQGLNQ